MTCLRDRLLRVPRCAVQDEHERLNDLRNHSGIGDRVLLILSATDAILSQPLPSQLRDYLHAATSIVEISRCIGRIQALAAQLRSENATSVAEAAHKVLQRIACYRQALAGASHYDDLLNHVIPQLFDEVSVKLAGISNTSSFSLYTSQSLELIVNRLEADPVGKTPTFSDEERDLYSTYTRVELQITLLEFAINAARDQVFQISKCQESFICGDDRETLVASFQALTRVWAKLLAATEKYRREIIQKRQADVIIDLLPKLILSCDNILTGSDDTERKVVLHKMSARALRFAREVHDMLAHQSCWYDAPSLGDQWAQLDLQWKSVSDHMVSLQEQPKHCETVCNTTAPNLGARFGGLDLGMNVSNHAIPLSVKRTSQDATRLKPISEASDGTHAQPQSRGHTPTVARLSHFNDPIATPSLSPDDYDTLTLVSRAMLDTPFSSKSLLAVQLPSRIPRIMPNYLKLGYPRIRKNDAGLRLPTISATHPVFESPCPQNTRLHLQSPATLVSITERGLPRPILKSIAEVNNSIPCQLYCDVR